ncbi:MAG: histidine phosphatase family protein [archaeon]|nr:histidine phosphatase family protein [archaeon]
MAASGSPGHFPVEFVCANNVPKADFVGHADPYIYAWICSPPAGSTFAKMGDSLMALADSGSSAPAPAVSAPSPSRRSAFKKKFKPTRQFTAAEIKESKLLCAGDLVRSERIYDQKDPVWHCVRDFRIQPKASDVLIVVMYDWDKTDADDLLASVAIPVSLLAGTGELLKVPFTLYKAKKELNCSLTLRSLPTPNPFPTKRTFFLIRHGESQWNEAQGKKSAKGMVKTTDHGLNLVGIQQAQAFNAKWRAAESSPRVEQWRAADQVFVSPLTRAIQTCFLTMDTHPGFFRGAIALPSLREAKNLGGLDTIGKVSGDKIRSRFISQLQKTLSAEQFAALNLGYDLDLSRCPHPWWTPAGNKEGPKTLARRIHDFVSTIQFSGSDQPVILVGHSLLFKEFVKTHLSEAFKAAQPAFAAKLAAHKLGNASCLAVDVVFQDWPLPLAEIVNAELMFGGDFHYE